MPATLRIVPWNDPVLDTLGHDPRSHYVETFWLPTLGPTALLLLRHLADRFDHRPEGIELIVATTCQALGLGQRDGNSSPVVRTLNRLAQFDLSCDDGRGTFAVRRNLPPVNRRHVKRLPGELQTAHAEWAEARLTEGTLEIARRNARRIALPLAEQGETFDYVERVLHATGFHPALAYESARWAHEQRREAAPIPETAA
jgi:hypothetical protein